MSRIFFLIYFFIYDVTEEMSSYFANGWVRPLVLLNACPEPSSDTTFAKFRTGSYEYSLLSPRNRTTEF